MARINRRAAARVRRGHAWVYRSDIVDLPAAGPGLVRVVLENGNEVGTAMFSPRSTITLRLVAGPGVSFDGDLLAARWQAALDRRRRLLPGWDAFRVVHGEADGLPGLYVDRYDDCVAVMSTCAAADLLEPALCELVAHTFAPRAIVLRDDTTGRRREGLPERVSVWRGTAPVRARYHEEETTLEVDLLHDQKTGGFLDQAHNHVAVRRFARGQGLDCFTYHGGFALQLARHCDHVVAVDQSQPALTRAAENARGNGITNLKLVNANVFDLLRQYQAEARRFACIVLDPPAFASSAETLPRALRAYKEINLRALKLLAPGGTLVTCSCSGRVRPEAFDEMLLLAARDARRPVQLLERRGAGPDHPVLLALPETEYLKCRVLLAP